MKNKPFIPASPPILLLFFSHTSFYCCCLLNAEKQHPQGRQKQSRGHIPIAWISVSKFDFHKTPLDLYAPFELITIENINRSIIIKKHNWNERKFKSEVLNPKALFMVFFKSLQQRKTGMNFKTC